MTEFINIVVRFYRSILMLLDSVVFDLAGYNVSFGAVLFVCIALYMVVSIYWRGAKG